VTDEHRHPVGLIQPHDITESKWEVISMDFFVGFPLTPRRHDSIFMVFDTMMKSEQFIPVRIMYEASNMLVVEPDYLLDSEAFVFSRVYTP
jgi:hypothetical protein